METVGKGVTPKGEKSEKVKGLETGPWVLPQ